MRLAVSLSALMINVEQATCTPAQAEEGTLTATFAQMDDNEASRMARAIADLASRVRHLYLDEQYEQHRS